MYVTTDPAYAEACDDQYMFMDYVSVESGLGEWEREEADEWN